MNQRKELQDQQAEEQFWEQKEAYVSSEKEKSAPQNVVRFVLVKSVTILFIIYIGWSYRNDLSYLFSNPQTTTLPTVTIDTEDQIDFNKWHHHNQYVSLKGWIELEHSFAIKIGFSRYDILKLWHLPVFIAIKQGEKGLVKSRIAATIPTLTINGRYLNYYQALLEGGIFSPYSAIGKGFFRITHQKMPQNSVIIMAHEMPRKDFKLLIILGLMLIYILYSIYKIFRLVILMKQKG